MSVLTAVFLREEFVGYGDITEIDSSIEGLIDIYPIRGGTWAIAGYISPVRISTQSGCFFGGSTTPSTLPPNADPPFPPVYPYPWASDSIYGRDNLALNLKFIRQDTFIFDIAVVLDGDPVNLTGCSLKMTAKWSVLDADASAVFTLSTATSGIEVTDVAGGLATITIPSTATASLPYDTVNLVYDIQLTDSIGQIFTVNLGGLKIVPDVSRV